MKNDWFSNTADDYLKFRPRYPEAFLQFILGLVDQKNTALDCGAGSGQTTLSLMQNFQQVYAIDISIKQLDNLPEQPNLTKIVCKAEEVPLPEGSIDLITASAAVHWFKLEGDPNFYQEAIRLLKNKGVLAVWSYGRMNFPNNPVIEQAFDYLYDTVLSTYWTFERHYVDEEYKTLPFPFDCVIANQSFAIEENWNSEQILGYLNTWSSVERYKQLHASSPLLSFENQLNSELKPNEQIKVIWPLFYKVTVINK